MSFLSRATPILRTAAALPRTMSARPFSTSLHKQNIIKETAQKVNKVVSDQLTKGIDAGAELKEGAEAAINSTTEKVKEQAANLSSQVQGKVSELQGKASELQGEAKGKAEELKGQAKGKAEEVKGQAKATAEEVKSKL